MRSNGLSAQSTFQSACLVSWPCRISLSSGAEEVQNWRPRCCRSKEVPAASPGLELGAGTDLRDVFPACSQGGCGECVCYWRGMSWEGAQRGGKGLVLGRDWMNFPEGWKGSQNSPAQLGKVRVRSTGLWWDGRSSSGNGMIELTATACSLPHNSLSSPVCSKRSLIAEILQIACSLEIRTGPDSPGLYWRHEYSGQVQGRDTYGWVKQCWSLFIYLLTFVSCSLFAKLQSLNLPCDSLWLVTPKYRQEGHYFLWWNPTGVLA